MTKITLCKDKDTYSVRAIGHAEGYPLVCAAISTLLFSLVGWLKNNGKYVEIHTEKMDSADAEIVFSGGNPAKIIYEFMLIAFLQLQKTEPKGLSVGFF